MSVAHQDLLQSDDDGFHPNPDDPWHTEGSWWCFFDRDRRLGGWIYHLTRLNLGYATGGVWVWDGSARHFAEVPYFHDVRPQRLPAGDHDLRHFTWPDGVTLDTLEPLRRYRLTYDDGDRLSLDLRYEGIMAPYVTASGDPPRVTRFEQPCHVTGQLVLHGAPIAIDCVAMRDHSWGPRADSPTASTPSFRGQGAHLAERPAPYLYATASPDAAFVVMAGHGVLVRDGRRTDLVAVDQRIERDVDGCPLHFIVEAATEDGRRLHAEGETLSAILRPSQSHSIGWICVVDWEFDGHRALGDVQDVWPIPAWREYRAWLRSASGDGG